MLASRPAIVFLLLITGHGLQITAANAQLPPLINYQGRLIQGTNLANGTMGLSLRLYDVPSSGSPLYEDSNSVSVVDGLYSTHLGDGTVAGSLSAALASTSLWVEVVVNGTVLTPRERVTSVAYALLSGGVTAGAISSAMLASGVVQNIHIAPGAVDSASIADGGIGSADLGSNAVTPAAIADGAVTAGKLLQDQIIATSYFVVTNPTPHDNDSFGFAICFGTSNRVLVSSRERTNSDYIGAAYIYASDGTLLQTLTNPSPTSGIFGTSFAALPTGWLVSLPTSSTTYAGRVYRYDLDGVLTASVTNPFSATSINFGHALCAAGTGGWAASSIGTSTNRSIITVYDATDALVAAITSPPPGQAVNWGFALQGLSSNRIAIGDYGAPHASGTNLAGRVYIHDLSGALQYTIENPTPFPQDRFGYSICAPNPNLIVVGAPRDREGGIINNGAVHLFTASGSYVSTVTNPNPGNVTFGNHVWAQSTNLFGVSAPQTDTPGQAFLYLFDDTGQLELEVPLTPGVNTPSVVGGFDVSGSGESLWMGDVGYDLPYVVNGRIIALNLGRSMQGFISAAPPLFSIEPGMLEMGAVLEGNLASGSVTHAAMQTNSVGSGQLIDESIQSGDIAYRTLDGDTLANDAVSGRSVAGQTLDASDLMHEGLPQTVIPNPNPVAGDNFGHTIRAVGHEMFAIAAPWAPSDLGSYGTVYLYNSNFTLAATIENPTFNFDGQFGAVMAPLSSSRFVIGHPRAGSFVGRAYIVSTNGTLLVTVTNPIATNVTQFGYSAAFTSTNALFVAAPPRIYRYDTNGVILGVITNPRPDLVGGFQTFGYAMAPVSTNRVAASDIYAVIGGYNSAGAVYLLSSTGTLVTTISNPAPLNAFFGSALCRLGNGWLAVCSPQFNRGGIQAGAVYLYDANGSPKGVIHDPEPTNNGGFGRFMSALGTNRIVIGDSTQSRAYIFDINGAALGTMRDPSQSSDSEFGKGVATSGERICIGAPGDVSNAVGKAYIFYQDKFFVRDLVAASVQDGAITASKLASNAVGSANIIDGSIAITDVDPSGFDTRYVNATGDTMSGGLVIGNDLRINDSNIWLRADDDTFHGLGWYGSGKSFAGVNPDGPVLFGYGGGGLGYANDSGTGVVLRWNGSGQVGIGTSSPAARLDVAGSFRINSGTIYSRLQSGVATAGTSAAGFKVFTNTFPVAFSSTPAVQATTVNDPGFPNVNDTFTLTIRNISATNFVANIQRVDTNGGWSQNLRVSWSAWE